MTNYIGWTPPPGAVVEPPVHPETRVSVIYSDAHVDEDEYLAHRLNWSAIGDGPSIVAYAVVEEYKPASEREWWLTDNGCWWRTYDAAKEAYNDPDDQIIHVREVPDPSREVVAWAVVREDGEYAAIFRIERLAASYAKNTGGTVVKLTGVRP